MSDVAHAYRPGLAQAQLLDPALADSLARHTGLGDPLADAVFDAFEAARQAAWLRDGIERGTASIPDAPAELHAFLRAAEDVPPWFDADATRAGCRAFHGHSEMFIGAFVGAVLIEGFATLISQSFSFGVLAALRLRNQADQLLRRISPSWDSRRRASQFARMMDLSFDDPSVISYRLPRFLHTERDG